MPSSLEPNQTTGAFIQTSGFQSWTRIMSSPDGREMRNQTKQKLRYRFDKATFTQLVSLSFHYFLSLNWCCQEAVFLMPRYGHRHMQDAGWGGVRGSGTVQ